MRMTRRGASLVELVVAIGLTGALAVLLSALTLGAQRQAQGLAERVAAEAALRTGAQVLATELRSAGMLAPGDPDLLQQGSAVVSWRAERGMARACDADSTALLLDRSTGRFSALRLPAAGRDTLLVLIEGAMDTGADDRWVPLGVTGASSASTCPGLAPALRVPVAGLAPHLPGLVLGGPVRWFEIMSFRSYASGGADWLGVQSLSAGELVQPLLGPLEVAGLQLTYHGAGGPPMAGDQVRLVRGVLAVRFTTGQAAGGAVASGLAGTRRMRAAVVLRNLP